MTEPLRVLVVGVGSAGRRHLATLIARDDVVVGACRRSEQAAAETRTELGIDAFAGLDAAAEWRPDAVVVANPTSEHVETTAWAVERGCHVLVEKPLSHSLAGVERLEAAVAAHDVCLAVANNLRFHPALEAVRQAVAAGAVGRLLSVRSEVGQYLPDWHPDEDYRHGYAASAALGGGALLTLVHELDYVLWIAGEAHWSSGVRARVSRLELDVEDVAEVLLAHTGGTVSSVHVDFLDRAYNRRSRWVGEDGSIEWRWGGPVQITRSGGREDMLWQDDGFDVAETYRAEMSDFLGCVREGGSPRSTLADGRRALEVAATVFPLPGR